MIPKLPANSRCRTYYSTTYSGLYEVSAEQNVMHVLLSDTSIITTAGKLFQLLRDDLILKDFPLIFACEKQTQNYVIAVETRAGKENSFEICCCVFQFLFNTLIFRLEGVLADLESRNGVVRRWTTACEE